MSLHLSTAKNRDVGFFLFIQLLKLLCRQNQINRKTLLNQLDMMELASLAGEVDQGCMCLEITLLD